MTTHHGPVISALVRLAAFRELRKDRRWSLRGIEEAFVAVGEAGVEAAFAVAMVEPPEVGGPIIDGILAWLRSPAGQAVIAALVKLLLAFLLGL